VDEDNEQWRFTNKIRVKRRIKLLWVWWLSFSSLGNVTFKCCFVYYHVICNREH
jgi:hypothetical protein